VRRPRQGRGTDGVERAALVAYAWLAVFFLAPLALVLKLSLSDVALAIPPYAPRLDWSQGPGGLARFLGALDGEAYARLAGDRVYLDAFLSSLGYAVAATAVLLAVGYPMALAMARAPARLRPLLVAAVAVPFWTSLLVRTYAWIAVLRPEGWLNMVGARLGLPPLSLLHTDAAVYIGLVYAYLPFMVLPLYAALERQDEALLEAAADLGAGPWTAFRTVTLPMSAPAVAGASLLCLIPITGEFVIPDLLGGSSTLMAGKLIWTEFFGNRDWPTASAAGMVLILLLAGPILLHQRLEDRRA
jgi:putrescine transport system permease protein